MLLSSLLYRVILISISAIVMGLIQYGMSNPSMFDGITKLNGGKDARVEAMVSRPDTIKLSDIGGNALAKDELTNSVVIPLQNANLFYRSGIRSIRPPNGVLLHGPPGTGKTMLARAVATESGVPMITLHSAALESKWWGESPKLLEAVFKEARTRYAPCVIFIDELDGMGRARSENDQSCVYSFKCELLRNIDSIQGEPVVLLACTNFPKTLDAALSRRFQRKVEIPCPDIDGRRAILNILMHQEHPKSVKSEEIADLTEHFSGAELTNLYEAACSARMTRSANRIAKAKNDADIVRILGPLTLQDIRGGSYRISLPLVEVEDVPRVQTNNHKNKASITNGR
jgi:ATP-dependent 26S proteasome regulatory subunit